MKGKAVAVIEFYDRIMSETMELLVEARRYLSERVDANTHDLTINQGLISSVETMRLVSRLTETLAWVLTQRAVLAGELTEKEALMPERRLSGHNLCGLDTSEDVRIMPTDFQSLMSRSLELYQRIVRLDAQINERATHFVEKRTWPPQRGKHA